MSASPPPAVDRAALAIALGALLVAAVGPFRSAESANDGSRLATVECLVDHGTLAIDQATFDPVGDKILIRGRFYSHQPPVQAVLMAGLYRVLQAASGLRAGAHPEWFCYLMTLGTSGLAYVVALLCFYRVTRSLGLALFWRAALTLSLGLATIALPYVRAVNAHILVLALACAVLDLLTRPTRRPDGSPGPGLGLALGFLTGLAYALDQACGGLLLGGVTLYLLLQWRRPGPALLHVAGALPWLLLHHGIIYALAGTFRPIGALPEHFSYPGSSFHAGNMTGRWNHPSFLHFLAYAPGLLFGNRGLLQASLPALLVFPAVFVLARGRRLDLLALLACGWALATWLVYAALSTNFSGSCCSVRWLLPLLAACYYLIALLVRDHPRFRADFLVLTGWGMALGGLMWWEGPWIAVPPFFWCVQAAALATWLGCATSIPSLPGVCRFRDAVLLTTPVGLAAIVLTAVLPWLLEPRPVRLVSLPEEQALAGQAVVLLLLAAVVGLRARKDAGEMPWGGLRTLLFGLLALGMTGVHWLLVDADPPRARWQLDLYLGILNGTAGAPHQLRPLPYGFARLLERLTGSWLVACLAYRWFFTFWLLWCAERFARLFLSPPRAALAVLPLVLLYPLSILRYLGQLTDPLSHTLIVFSLICVVRNRPLALGAALVLSIWAKETGILVVPVYLACHFRAWPRAWLNAVLLGATGVLAFLAARGAAWSPSFDRINGTTGLMVGTNLGVGEPIAFTSVSLVENYLHPLLFLGVFLPGILRSWRSADPRLKVIFLTFTPLLMASNLGFGWMYESRNYVPLVPVLAALAFTPRRPAAPQRPRSECQSTGA